ncbi:hypothetical protein DB313_05030 (plasmid) [Borrelia turcica IST7]|uniref:Uncharacterized protein n=1 Tax=Borrelia turcica IST7 TaxID=1104446 RepID=A0A386PPG6_9SPIR|nr:hypothetical protein [Borrelia turcica]AYE36863.1 hypothetical protein DB313_05030 [Borrelia turcica IST7]
MIFKNLAIKTILLSVLLASPLCLFSLNEEGDLRSEVRVYKWRTNFNNLSILDSYFLATINDFKSMSGEDLLHKLKLCLMVTRNEKGDSAVTDRKALLKRTALFLTKLKDKNADKAAYLLYELDSLSLLLLDTIELANMLTHEESVGVQKHYHEYKESLEKRLPLIDKYKKEFLSSVSILDHNKLDKSFQKFMPKFADLYNSTEKVYSKLHKHYTQFIIRY